jgi:hypothetical protein
VEALMFRHFAILGILIAAAACAQDVRVELRSADGKVVAATDRLSSTLKGDKRKYSDKGAEVAVVKIGTDEFKVKDLAGNLRWKVKVKGDKVKVGRDEEMKDDWELRTYADHVKLKQGEKEIARIGVDLAKESLKLEKDGTTTEYKVTSPRITAGFAVLALPGDEVDRSILLAEIVALGR